MDPVTHSLTGLALARAGLNRAAPHATLLLIAASNAPDIDIVSGLFGTAPYLEFHRGPTHSLLFAPLCALLPVAFLRWGLRRPVPLLQGWLLSLLAIVVHLGMDFLTSYGMKPLWPLANQWTQWPVLYITDIYVIAALILSVAAPGLSGLVSSEIGAKRGTGRGWAIAAIAFILLWIAGRGLLHDRAGQMLASHVYQGRAPRRTIALPTPFNPLRWRGLVECEGFLTEHDIHVLQEFDPDQGTIYVQPRQTDRIAQARRAPEMKRFLDFAQWPSFRLVPLERPAGAVRIDVRDLRFPTGFEAMVELDATGQVMEEDVTISGRLRDNSRRP